LLGEVLGVLAEELGVAGVVGLVSWPVTAGTGWDAPLGNAAFGDALAGCPAVRRLPNRRLTARIPLGGDGEPAGGEHHGDGPLGNAAFGDALAGCPAVRRLPNRRLTARIPLGGDADPLGVELDGDGLHDAAVARPPGVGDERRFQVLGVLTGEAWERAVAAAAAVEAVAAGTLLDDDGGSAAVAARHGVVGQRRRERAVHQPLVAS